MKLIAIRLVEFGPALLSLMFILAGDFQIAQCEDASVREESKGDADRGWKWLNTKPYLPSDLDDEVFADLWTVWPGKDRNAVAQATPAKRRAAIFKRYGLTAHPTTGTKELPLGYLRNKAGGWVMNCLACHAGEVAGQVIPGLGNSRFALHSLTEDVRKVKLKQFKAPAHMDVASMKMPLGTTHGTTNAVAFGVILGGLRDLHMNVYRPKKKPREVHHDMDAPPYWNVKYKTSLYIDGFAPKNHRVLMQFMLLPSNSAQTLREWEPDFRDVLAWIESRQAPKYPFEIDQAKADQGRVVFEKSCSRCHGTYGKGVKYQQKMIDIDEVGTDPVRLQAIGSDHRKWMRDSWMSRYGKEKVDVDPKGYVAPPLRGIWASAPYFHNGSVPTLWHVLHSAQRPKLWRREDNYDKKKVGIEYSEFEKLPKSAATPYEKRRYFDTAQFGKSAAGHEFPNELSDSEKMLVLEYLKTL
jgi:hypothetical protein